MIRVVMLGRLGNNLFQYAFGRVLAERHGGPLVLDGSWFNEDSWRFASPLGSLPGFTKGRAKLVRPFSFGSRVLRKVTGRHHWQYLGLSEIQERQADHSFDISLHQAPADCVVFGYFQSHLYFDGIKKILRDELNTDDLGLERGHEELAALLKAPTSVAIHVRRTDYLANPRIHQLNLDWYHRAMDLMRERVAQARFFVFSDDPDWCLYNFKGPSITVCTHSNSLAPLVDLHLMKTASHHIIANSSFSWWAAWLGTKPGQQVIMPDRWFDRDITAPAAEKCLPEWTMLPIG